MEGSYGSKWWTLFIAIYDAIVFAYIIAGLVVQGLEVITKPYFSSLISSVLVVNGAYLATMGERKGLKDLKHIGTIIMITGFAFLLLMLITRLPKSS